MNKYLVLLIIQGRFKGVNKTPIASTYSDNLHYKVLYDQYKCNKLMWYSQSKKVHMNVNDMNTQHINNCLNLLITKQGRWGYGVSSVSESIRDAWILVLNHVLEERNK